MPSNAFIAVPAIGLNFEVSRDKLVCNSFWQKSHQNFKIVQISATTPMRCNKPVGIAFPSASPAMPARRKYAVSAG
jgi:hypothetical protein